MSFLRATLVCLVAAAAAAPSLAQDSAATSSAIPPAPIAKPVKEHRICHQDVATGSIMPHSTCHTKEEWAAIATQDQRQVDQIRMHRGGGAAGN